jgi:AhpC/TSA family
MSLRPGVPSLTAVGLTLAFASAASSQLATPTTTRPPMLAAGDKAAVIESRTLDGTFRRIDYPKGKITVLLFFMSSCHICHGMIPEWNRVYENHTPDVDIVGVMVDEAPAEYVAKLDIHFPIVKAPLSYREQFKVFSVPQTIRVSEGIVQDIAVGHIDAMRLGELVRPPDKPKASGKAAAKH